MRKLQKKLQQLKKQQKQKLKILNLNKKKIRRYLGGFFFVHTKKGRSKPRPHNYTLCIMNYELIHKHNPFPIVIDDDRFFLIDFIR